MKHFLIIDLEKNVLVAPVKEEYLTELIKSQDLMNVIRCQNKATVKKVIDMYFKSDATYNKEDILLKLEEEALNKCRKK